MNKIVTISIKNGVAIVEGLPQGVEVYLDEQDVCEQVRYWTDLTGEIFCDIIEPKRETTEE